MRHFSYYLESLPFTIITDHHCLLYLDKMKDTKARLTHWALILQPYSYKILHKAGALHGNADALSRMSQFKEKPQAESGGMLRTTVWHNMNFERTLSCLLHSFSRNIYITHAILYRAFRELFNLL